MNKKPVRTRGKLMFSRYFQKFNDGDRVAIVRELSIPKNFPERFQGRTGTIDGKRGRIYFVKIKDQNREKRLLVAPIHLRKIE